MNQSINRERLAETFTTLCEISSPSRKEGAVAQHLKKCFAELSADEIIEDNSAAQTGSECGNLIVRFNGNNKAEGVFFSCHMDTVAPAENVQVVRNGDVFTSAGETVLGGDDKSGIAAIIELLHTIKENSLPHGPIEIVLTTCEEIGLLGAKALEHKHIKAPYGYALDSTGIDSVIIGAPAASKLKIEIHGLAAHAGLNPEQGINSIQIASDAINRLKLGRIDEETTANIGIIEAGVATNIVPPLTTVKGEVRSHDIQKLKTYTMEIEKAFHDAAADYHNPSAADGRKPTVTISTEGEYPAMKLETDSPVLQRLYKAEKSTGKKLQYLVAGGGSDANIINGFGLPTAIIATGMNKVHTIDEQLDLNDLASLTELLIGIASEQE
ncbi:M20/M25/M40 family metallo-hydrolase [Desulfopila sp. IMCC35008]|uniref:M20/M25/M40 family metallo-hydrolase n=1 Tax=Desulfopila sp. IMCC35008 TaxID=2653858 RepID=UPI0013D225EF|nr:M20/M25/M40 family metallo-hydrolase [Desulfopila sp. IMCC35008]